MLPIYQKFRLSHTFIFSSLSPDLINKYRLSKLNNIKLVVNSLSKGTWNIQTFCTKMLFFVYRTFYVFGRYKKSQMYDMRSHSNHVSCLIALYYCQHIYKYQIKNNDKNYILFNITNEFEDLANARFQTRPPADFVSLRSTTNSFPLFHDKDIFLYFTMH